MNTIKAALFLFVFSFASILTFAQEDGVKHGLELGSYGQCFACRMPLSDEEMASPAYAEGVSCPHCIDARNEEQRARYAERQKQQKLARKRGEEHIGKRLERDAKETADD